jgi:hypothetical protein
VVMTFRHAVAFAMTFFATVGLCASVWGVM